jgi:hypothetical protein
MYGGASASMIARGAHRAEVGRGVRGGNKGDARAEAHIGQVVDTKYVRGGVIMV